VTHYEALARENWQGFFDTLSRTLEGNLVSIEVIGLDIGDQIEATGLAIHGITFERRDNAIYVYADGENNVAHHVAAPRAVYVEVEDGTLRSIVVLGDDGHEQIIRLASPVMLPARATAWMEGVAGMAP
jgi:hypothetical protein